MTLGDDTQRQDDGANRSVSTDVEGDAFASTASPGSNASSIGSTLKSIYHQTVEEAVPDEMLALLGKLD